MWVRGEVCVCVCVCVSYGCAPNDSTHMLLILCCFLHTPIANMCTLKRTHISLYLFFSYDVREPFGFMAILVHTLQRYSKTSFSRKCWAFMLKYLSSQIEANITLRFKCTMSLLQPTSNSVELCRNYEYIMYVLSVKFKR